MKAIIFISQQLRKNVEDKETMKKKKRTERMCPWIYRNFRPKCKTFLQII